MKIDLEDFGTGWYGLNMALHTSEIDELIKRLIHIKDQPGDHFHICSTFAENESSGIADIEFSVMHDSETSNSRFG